MDLRGKLPTRQGAAPYLLRSLADLQAVHWLVVHHTDVGPARPTALEVAQYQVGPTAHLPFPSIAYHLFVEEDGTFEQTQDFLAVPWSQGDGSPYSKQGVAIYNWWGLSICFSGQDPTACQIATIQRARDWVRQVVGNPALPVIGHRDVSPTECPGDLWDQWKASVA